MARYPSRDFWKSKKVLVTGHTGFKGSWLSLYLSELGAQVHGLSLSPTGDRDLYSDLGLKTRLAHDSRTDIRNRHVVREIVREFKPEVVFHLAAQSLVSEGYRSPLATLSTNLMGTANVLDAVREAEIATVVVAVSTDKVYANSGAAQAFSENDPLGGTDPYSASKAGADLISQMFSACYLEQAGIPLGIARAGNVIGGGDWSRDRLFPDLARAWSMHQALRLRSPTSTRPWQHVLEPLRGYILLAENLFKNPKLSIPFNFGPDVEDSLSVGDVVKLASDFWPGNPGWVEETEELFKEAKFLAIDNSRAKQLLNLSPIWSSKTAIERTTGWYREHFAGATAEILCLEDIHAFEVGK